MHEHDDEKSSPFAPETIAVTTGRPPHVPGAPVNYPIGLSTTFHAGAPDHGYIREGTVATEAFESVLGQLEHGHAVVFSSGMATVNAVADLVPAGGKVVAPNHSYPGTLARLRELAQVGRLRLVEVQIDNLPKVLSEIVDADLIWLETPTNPLMEIADIQAVVAAKPEKSLVVVDNTFMSPALQQPLELGADISMHSATKSISGHSDALLGVLIAADPAVETELKKRRLLQGSFPGALEVYLGLRGIRTLQLRVERASENALVIAQRLQKHPKVASVLYPGLANHNGHALHAAQASGFGSVLSVILQGDAAEAERVCQSTYLWTHATSLGGVESTLERRRKWPAESLDTSESLLRLSVGIENVEDLWNDLNQALG